MDVPALVARLGDARTSQQEKAQIFTTIESFRTSPDAWRLACEYLQQQHAVGSNNADATVALFFLNCLESYCSSLVRFESLPQPHGRLLVRETLLQLVASTQQQLLLRKKASLILVMMGQREFGTTWPDFAQQCCAPGFDLLLLSCCENVQEYTKISLTKFRQQELERYCARVAAPLFITRLTMAFPGNQQVFAPCAFALTEWIPLDQVSLEFIQALSQSTLMDDANAALAIHALANILDRNYFPPQEPHASQFLDLVAMRALGLLEAGASESRVEAVIAFLHALTKRHFAKLQTSHTFPVQRFLEQMFAFTFSLRNVESLYQALEVWELFIEVCQEYEASAQAPSPLAAPVIAPLLVRLLDMFIFSKTQASKQFLLDLGEAFTLNSAETENKEETSDLDVIVARIMELVQRTSFLPFSSAAGLSQLLNASYMSLSQCAGNLLSNSGDAEGTFAAHDCQVNLQIVSACAPLFVLPDFAALPQVRELATWTMQIIRLCLDHSLWQRSAYHVRVHTQALVCVQAMLAWGKLDGKTDFEQSSSALAMETLQRELLPEATKLRAVLLLKHGSGLWVDQTPVLFDFTQAYSDPVRRAVYSAFAHIATSRAEGEALTLLTRALAKDVQACALGRDHEKKRSVRALQAVVEVTVARPETVVKRVVYQAAIAPVIPACLDLLRTNSSLVVLDLLLACFKHLRRQLGDAGCAHIVQQAMQASTASSSSSSSSTAAKVFSLLLCVVEEPSKAFDALLLPILQQCQTVIVTSDGDGELDEIASRVIFALLLNHYRWVTTMAVNEDVLALACELLIGQIRMETPPDLVREICHSLAQLQAKHGLLVKLAQTNRERVLRAMYVQCLQLIASHERELICDELLELLFALANAVPDFFFDARQAILDWPRANTTRDALLKDQGLFQETVLGLI